MQIAVDFLHKKVYTQRKTHFNIVSGKEFTHFNIYYTQKIAQINSPCEKIIKLLNCKPRFRFARVSSSLAEFAKESAENEG